MSPYNYCAGNPVVMVDPDGMKPTLIKYMEPNNELYFRTAITLGGQIGFNFADFASFELNLGAIDLISLNFKGKDGKGGVDAWTVRHVAEDYPRVTQKGSIGVGIPVAGDASLKAEKVYNDPTVGEEANGGFYVDIAKVSFAIKLILGFEIEANCNIVEGNSFVKVWEVLKYMFNSVGGDSSK